ncbi:hypothetical protein Leryth_005604 [Lithospermum erythrorhizon]|nr:hypothetical protein Leryth_005604 [Lithospermum erythrorhizon]
MLIKMMHRTTAMHSFLMDVDRSFASTELILLSEKPHGTPLHVLLPLKLLSAGDTSAGSIWAEIWNRVETGRKYTNHFALFGSLASFATSHDHLIKCSILPTNKYEV